VTTQKIATVFGGTGFIGCHVVQRLAGAGYTVRVPTRNPAAANVLCPLGSPGQIVPMHFAPAQPALMEAALARADVVVNLLGILYERKEDEFRLVHVETAGNIARLAKAAGVKRMVHISALGARAGSSSRYARTKAEGEQAVLGAFPEATLLRPSVVFGPEDKFFNRFASMMAFSPALPLIGGGKTKFQPVYVGDVADAVLAAITRNDTQGKVYELGGPRVATFRELMELLLQVTGHCRILVRVPWLIARIQGVVLGLLPHPPLTLDQVRLLRRNSVVREDALTFKDLGLSPKAMEAVLPAYLARYKAAA